jgi:hypothetical protein
MRTTPGAVQEILGSNYDSINCPSLKPYIDSASVVMDRVVVCATAKGITHTVSELRLMEMWVAAYLYTISDPIYKSKATADASATFMDRSYLDAAKMIDTSGCLNSIMSGNRASLDWLGKPISEQIDYFDRNY